MALNRFLSSETGSVKVDVVNAVLKTDASGTVGTISVSDTVAQASLVNIDTNTGNTVTELGTELAVADTDARGDLALIEQHTDDLDAQLTSIANHTTNFIKYQDPYAFAIRSDAVLTPVAMHGTKTTIGTSFTAVDEVIADGNPVFAATSNVAIRMQSSNAGDTTQDVTIHYVQLDGTRNTETKTLTGSTDVTFTATGVMVEFATTDALTTGDVLVFGTGDPTSFAGIQAGRHSSERIARMVSASKVLVPVYLSGSSSGPAVVRMHVVPDVNGAGGDSYALYHAVVDGHFTADMRGMAVVPETSHVTVDARALSGTVDASFMFFGLEQD